ncbi:tail protein X [Rhodothalassium salexigens]|uniref:tail protein X n=1 Tax=Rhodothalassium salexigens TaxID=1086 RepID=UPI0019083F07|nr:tail protein X [Rhodothalassium salexigens]MBK1638977.1 hypothetical protein [Rhodothalassium salexigens DSM 2132]
MTQLYETRAGDRLDQIALGHYGAQAGVVERILDANPDLLLAGHGPVLPAGLRLVLPDLPATPTDRVVRLFG